MPSSASEPEDAAELTSEGDVCSQLRGPGQESASGDAFFDARGGNGFDIDSTWKLLPERSRNANGVELFMLGLLAVF